MSTETTRILDALFHSGYDRQIRPQIAGPPLEVEVNIAIRSMGPVDEKKQTFALDCYFRYYNTVLHWASLKSEKELICLPQRLSTVSEKISKWSNTEGACGAKKKFQKIIIALPFHFSSVHFIKLLRYYISGWSNGQLYILHKFSDIRFMNNYMTRHNFLRMIS